MARTPGKSTLPANWRHPNPTLYTPEIGDEIIERVSAGETLIFVVRFDINGNPREPKTWPAYATIRDWADPADSRYRADFGVRFARARLHQMTLWIEETIDIANSPEIGIEEIYAEELRLGVSVTKKRAATGENGEKTFVSTRRLKKDMIAHRTLKIETRYKAAARLNPQLWAERLQAAGEIPNSENSRIIVVGGLPDDGQNPSDMIVDNDAPTKPND